MARCACSAKLAAGLRPLRRHARMAANFKRCARATVSAGCPTARKFFYNKSAMLPNRLLFDAVVDVARCGITEESLSPTVEN
ncbi:hypothetical protein AAMO2058_000901300 [Amorphochlora amoebiformis]